mgnify:CR=1 FL=1
MRRLLPLTAALAAALLLSACGKVTEKASEKMVEKAIEGQAKDGTKASVDLSGGTAKVTTTDASGKSSTMEWGGAQISEADLGVPFYGGAKPREGGASRVATPQATTMTVSLQSSDAPDKVTAFYREKLKAQSQGKQFMDMSMGEGQTTLMLADQQAQSSLQVHVAKAGASGSEINIVVTRSTQK